MRDIENLKAEVGTKNEDVELFRKEIKETNADLRKEVASLKGTIDEKTEANDKLLSRMVLLEDYML